MSEKQLLLPLYGTPEPLTATDTRSPEELLVDATGVLRRLHHTFSRNPNTKMMLDLVYSDIAYALDPDQLIAVQVPPKAPARR